MKYHYKSPEELNERAERRDQEVKGKRNRGNLLIFADLFVICLIFAGIYYSGALRPDRYVSTETTRHAGFEFSGSVELAADAKAPLSFYLNVKLIGDRAVVFPRLSTQAIDAQGAAPTAGDSPDGRVRATIEILQSDRSADASTTSPQERPVRFSTDYPLALRTIRPGETAIYRTELPVPGGTDGLQKGDIRIRLDFPDGEQAQVDL